MRKEELISVIIPIYNVEKYLEECIQSIINQKYKNLEIILVEDGSTDRSLDICNKYKKIDNRIKIIHQKNKGVSEARNVGVASSTGQYIGFVDGDDFIEEDMYKQLYQDLKKENADIAICDYYIYTTVKKEKSDVFTSTKSIMTTEEALIKMNELRGVSVSVCNKLYKREIFEGMMFPIGKRAEDWFIIYKVLERAKKIVYNPIAKYYYRQRNDSFTKSNIINWSGAEAALEVLEFTKLKYPKAITSAKFAYINANLEIYNQMLKKGYSIEQKKKIILNIKKEKKGVLKMPNIKLYKKMQIFCICKNRFLYDFIMKVKLKDKNIYF